ncbi:MAG: DUF427 domain-containing protein [Rhodospirillaceae bacterium]|nr:DUF427 domain-containing protein [Rhodospirillaceae bacterium]
MSPTACAMKVPGPDHPIAIVRHAGHVRVMAAGHVIAESRNALVLREAQYPPVYYIPRADADMTALARSSHSTWCPYKGACSYFDIGGSAKGANAVWTYESPHEAVAEIKDHLAFYPDRVDGIEVG